MYKLTLDHHFAASHQLRNAYSKECNQSLHGHNWKVRVEIEADYLIDNMIVDFKELKAVIDKLDHVTLLENIEKNGKLFNILHEMGNKVVLLNFELTAENLVAHIQKEVKSLLTKRYKDEGQKPEWYEGEEPFKVIITLWEADKASIKFYE
jgi:6-pyruvoyl-tetrahydropterin synthase